eukprot:gene5136-34942_t
MASTPIGGKRPRQDEVVQLVARSTRSGRASNKLGAKDVKSHLQELSANQQLGASTVAKKSRKSVGKVAAVPLDVVEVHIKIIDEPSKAAVISSKADAYATAPPTPKATKRGKLAKENDPTADKNIPTTPAKEALAQVPATSAAKTATNAGKSKVASKGDTTESYPLADVTNVIQDVRVLGDVTNVAAPPAKRRGRPPKAAVASVDKQEPEQPHPTGLTAPAPKPDSQSKAASPKAKRGRPAKLKTQQATKQVGKALPNTLESAAEPAATSTEPAPVPSAPYAQNAGGDESPTLKPAIQEESYEPSTSEAQGSFPSGPFDARCADHVRQVRAIMGIAGDRGVQLGEAPAGRPQQFENSMYISGLPGTGKSFTVSHAIKSVEHEVEHDSSSTSCTPLLVSLNCMSIKEPADVYRALLARCQTALQNGGKKGAGKRPEACAAVGGGKGAAAAAHGELLAMLQSCNTASGKSKGVRVVLLAVANSLDLTERLLPALKCRGCQPELVSFPSYPKKSVFEILSRQSHRLPWGVFDENALEYAARSVASNSGDLRHALKACSLAVELLAAHNEGKLKSHEIAMEEYRTAMKQYEVASAAASAARQEADQRSASAASEPAAPATAAGAVPSKEEVDDDLDSSAAAPDTREQEDKPVAPTALALKRTVGMVEMVAAISRLTGRAQQSAASSVVTIRTLPYQQQLILLATAMSVAKAAGSAAAARAAAAAGESIAAENVVATAGAFSQACVGIDRKSNPFASTPATVAPSGGGQASRGGLPTSAPAMCAGDAAMQVPAINAFTQYCSLCKEMCMRPVALPEFLDTTRLLSEGALLHIPGEGGRVGSKAAASRGGVKLCLKVSVRDVQAALKDNAVFRKVIGLM